MLKETGCAGVSIGRGAFYNPWIFKHTLHYLKPNGPQEPLPDPSFSERVRVMSRHLDLMIEVFGEELGCRMFRKVAPWHAKRFGPVSAFNKRVVLLSSRAQFNEILEHYLQWRAQFLDATGELQPRYCPPPMVASFMQAAQNDFSKSNFVGDESAMGTVRQQIPVPKGPVEVW
jgi:hypothetical protein